MAGLPPATSRQVVTYTTPLTLTAFSVDMVLDRTTNPAHDAVKTANISNRSHTLPDHAASNKIINALVANGNPHIPESLYVEFLWTVTGSEPGAKFFCQVNYEEIGNVFGDPSKDLNVISTAVDFVHLQSDYKNVVSVPISTTGATNLTPGLYTVNALLFVEVNGPATGVRNKGLGAFLEVGMIMVA